MLKSMLQKRLRTFIEGTMQEFTFASWEKEKEFEAYCLRMMEQ